MNDAEDVAPSHRGSRATSPGGYWREIRDTKVIEVSGLSGMDSTKESDQWSGGEDTAGRPSRYRPRTFPYQRYLPYRHQEQPLQNLDKCIRRLYVAVSAGDFVPGATHWTREIKAWMQLKFNMPRQDRIRLTKLYYELAVAPGMDRSASERFASMFMSLTK